MSYPKFHEYSKQNKIGSENFKKNELLKSTSRLEKLSKSWTKEQKSRLTELKKQIESLDDVTINKTIDWLKRCKEVSSKNFSKVETLKIQMALRNLNLYNGFVNAVYKNNPDMVEAIKKLQIESGVEPDGYLINSKISVKKSDEEKNKVLDLIITKLEAKKSSESKVAKDTPSSQDQLDSKSRKVALKAPKTPEQSSDLSLKTNNSTSVNNDNNDLNLTKKSNIPISTENDLDLKTKSKPSTSVKDEKDIKIQNTQEESRVSSDNSLNIETKSETLNSISENYLIHLLSKFRDKQKIEKIAEELGFMSEKEITAKYENRRYKTWQDDPPGVRKHSDTNKRVVTLDICSCYRGESEENTLKTLDFLIKEGLPVKIFVSGSSLKNPKIRQKIATLSKNPSAEIDIHGWDHIPFSVAGQKAYKIRGSRSVKELYWQIIKTAILIKKITGRTPKFSRSPTLFMDDVAVDICKDLGFPAMGRTGKSYDDAGANKNKAQIESTFLSRDSKNSPIFLGHTKNKSIYNFLASNKDKIT